MTRSRSAVVDIAALTLCAAIVSAGAASCAPSPARAQHVSAGCAAQRRIALTFDDGPNPPWTDRLLDVLIAAGARATFFDEGQAVEAHPETARKEVELGMAVGSHSYTHADDLPSLDGPAFAEDLAQTDAALRLALNDTPALYRAPYGHTSGTMLQELHRARRISIGWDVDSGDWTDTPPDQIVANVLDHAHPGAIVLMHDGGLGGGNPDRGATLAALPRVIDGLRDAGYDLVTVPELIGAPATLDQEHGRAPEATCLAS